MRRISARSKRLLIAVAAAVLVTAAVFALLGRVFVVRNVAVAGVSDDLRDEVIRASGLERGGSIRSVDEDSLRRSLESTGRFALDGVEVRYPNTVTLMVRERTRDAMVLSGARLLVMDADGYVIEAVDTVPEDAGVYITGLEGGAYRIGGRISAPEEKLAAMKAVLEAIRSQGASGYVSELNLSDVFNLTLTTRSGIRVLLGDANDMEGKILWMCSAVDDLQSRGQAGGTLDVSSGSKADYRPDEPAAEE